MSTAGDVILELRNVTKSFGPVLANDNVSLALRRGQIHGLVGENGSGKSTIIRTLSGAHQPDSGNLFHDGAPIVLDSPLAAREIGVATVFQEFSLVPGMTVAENVHLGKWHGSNINVDWSSMRSDARRILDDLDLDLSPDDIVGELPVARQQLVEIAKAMAAKASVIVLDEPTTALGVAEIEHLHDLLKRMALQGASILYVSHRLDEITSLCEVVTVMRNGRVVSEAGQTPLTVDAIVALMIGQDVEEHYPKANRSHGEPLLEVRDLTTARGLRGISFTVRRGEVLGLGGNLGSGRSAVARALFGVEQVTGGEILLRGEVVHPRNPTEAIACGFALLTENRNFDGLFFNFSGTENITIAALTDIDRGLWLDLDEEREISRRLIGRLEISATAETNLVGRLSGGNQQKLLVARWLNTRADVFILDEPTKGIDVGAKVAIYRLINDLTAAAKGVILISSDDKELLSLSDQVAIIRHGRVVRVAEPSSITKADLLASAEETRRSLL
jgi:ABC-type sugar transport system ATPase subunit